MVNIVRLIVTLIVYNFFIFLMKFSLLLGLFFEIQLSQCQKQKGVCVINPNYLHISILDKYTSSTYVRPNAERGVSTLMLIFVRTN